MAVVNSMGGRARVRAGRAFLVGCVALASLAAGFACAERGGQGVEPYHRTRPVPGAEALLGSAACLTCHGHQEAPRHHLDCESCHGPGERHVQNVLAASGVRFPANDDCLACHETGHRGLLDWELSEHERAGVMCSDCHDPHNGEPSHVRGASVRARTLFPQAGAGTTLCVDCHEEVGSELSLPSHHPVREGMLDCTSCHAPHASRDVRLGEVTEACTQCHQAQGGPYLYEHTPVVEDCGHCHVPHGASATPLLAVTQPGVCVSCHSVAEMGATHSPQAYVTRCTDCHNAVHGSYADPQLRR